MVIIIMFDYYLSKNELVNICKEALIESDIIVNGFSENEIIMFTLNQLNSFIHELKNECDYYKTIF